MHRELTDDSLAGPGRRAHQDTMAAFQRPTCLLLESVESELQFRNEPRQLARGGIICAAPVR
jgi:hypothetical protein